MNHALALNFAILIIVGICLVALQNPLALFGLILLKDLPYGLMVKDDDDEEEEESSPIGFVH